MSRVGGQSHGRDRSGGKVHPGSDICTELAQRNGFRSGKAGAGHTCRQPPVLRPGRTSLSIILALFLPEPRAASQSCPHHPGGQGIGSALPVEPQEPQLFCAAKRHRGHLTLPKEQALVI